MNKDASIDSVLNSLGQMKESNVPVIPNNSDIDPDVSNSIEFLVDAHIVSILEGSVINAVQIELLSHLLTYKAHAES